MHHYKLRHWSGATVYRRTYQFSDPDRQKSGYGFIKSSKTVSPSIIFFINHVGCSILSFFGQVSTKPNQRTSFSLLKYYKSKKITHSLKICICKLSKKRTDPDRRKTPDPFRIRNTARYIFCVMLLKHLDSVRIFSLGMEKCTKIRVYKTPLIRRTSFQT